MMLEDRDDEFHRVYDEPVPNKVLDSGTLRAPLSALGQRQPLCIRTSASIGDAILLMQDKHIGAVLVVDENERLVGIFSERDVIRRVAGRRLEWDSVSVETVMTPDPESLRTDDMVAYALNYMHMGGYRHVPIVDDQGVPVGIVSIKDVVAYLAEFFPQEVCNLPPEPMRLGPASRHGG
jgi:CBS domain-containing protein